MKSNPVPALMLVALAALSWTPAGAQQSDVSGAWLITGATVVDGTGAPPRPAAVRIRDGWIVEVGNLQPTTGEPVVEAGGLVLSPGFIDTHSHHDWGLDTLRDALAAVSQGITTIVVGQDGSSPFPLADFFQGLERAPPSVNVAAYAGHNTLRGRVMATQFHRPATAAETAYMRLLLEHELAAGALGLSTGLEYDPGIYSTTAEVIDLAQATARAGGRYISHIRSEDRYVWEAIEEIIEIGRTAKIPVQISHMKLAMRGLWGDAGRLLSRLDEARSRGIAITADVYSYTFWQSTMTVLFPERDWDNREAVTFVLDEIVPPEGVRIARYQLDPELEGKTLSEVAALQGRDPVTTFMTLIAEAQRVGADESMLGTSMDEGDVSRFLAWEHSNISSDGALHGRHPRGFGAFPRILARYVRARDVLSLATAIHKMTGLSAEHVGIANRGVLRPGARADMVLFDPQVITDRATPDDPHRTSVGIARVWVNGVEVYRDGIVTGARPGRVIRRGDP